jgi:iron(III) transport system ATP-binding protein
MDLVELDGGMRGRRPHELSGGQQQRVALARALARRPKLMLLDEPFSSLDPGLRDSLRRTVGRVLGAAGVTTILVTHDQAEALSFADHLAILREGRLVQAGPPRELYLHPGDADIAAFLGDALVLQARLGEGWADCSLGRVPADTGARRGAALIVLRPEQIQLTALPADDPDGKSDPAACYGRVTEVEFGGAACTATVTLIGGGPLGPAPGPLADPSAPLLVRGSSHDLPDAGTRVRITVRGKAHIVEPGAPAGDAAPP